MSNFTEYLSAFSGAVSAAAAYWAWRTATEAHQLSKFVTAKAEQDKFTLELERLTLAAAEIEAEATNLYFLAGTTRVTAASRAMAQPGVSGMSNSKFQLFIKRIDEEIAGALEATTRAAFFREQSTTGCEGNLKTARDMRIQATELCITLRGKIRSLEVERAGWVHDAPATDH